MRNVPNKIGENQAHMLCSIMFLPDYLAVYDTMWKNMVESDRPYVTI